MPENRHLRFLLRLLYAALALAGLWLALRFLLPWLLPFLLAFGLAALLEPAVRLLMERLHLPRRGAAALCTAALTAAVLGGLALVVWRVGYELSLLLGRLPFLLAFGLAALLEPAVRLLMERLHLPRRGAAALCTAALTAAVLGGLALVVWRVGYELSLLLGRLPTLLAGLPTLADGLERWAYRFLIALPVQFQTLARDALEGLLEQGIALPNRFYDALAGAVTGLASALPAAALFLFTTVLATYFTSAGRPALLDGLRRRLPPPWRTRLGRVAGGLREALGGWLKAQGLLMLITFGELAAGFLLLRVELSLLLAGLVALVDALPVFGTGTVLLPWAVLALLGGDVRMSVGLLVLYSVISLVRSLLEPRLVGARVGLPPLAALVCMYVGFQALGVLGMLLAPLAAVLARQLWDSGLLHSLFGP